MTGPTLVFLRSPGTLGWARVVDHLVTYDHVVLDLPAPSTVHAGTSASEQAADGLADAIQPRALTSYVLVGHGVGALVATQVAERAAVGEIGLSGIRGVILVAPALRPASEDASLRAMDRPVAIPALIVTGAQGVEHPSGVEVPRWRDVERRAVEGASPLEQPRALATLIDEYAARVAREVLPPHFAALLGSDRVSCRTRAVLLERTFAPERTGWWSEQEHATAAALVAQILPDCDAIDLSDRVLADVADGIGDGWRFAALPPDREAWRRALATLAAGGFATLDRHAQRDLLDRVDAEATGNGDDPAQLSPTQMALWFEDARAAVVRVWMSLPATMSAIGYDGFAVGGDGVRKQGYLRTHADEIEAWQRMPERLS